MTEAAIRYGSRGLRALAIGGLVALTLMALQSADGPIFCDLGSATSHEIPPTLWWTIASQRGTPETWDVAAAAYSAMVWRCTAERPVSEHWKCVDAAFAAVLAREHAWSAEAERATTFSLDVQPTRVRALFDATDTFVVLAFPDDRGWMLNEFREALLLWSLRQTHVIAELAAEREDRLTELSAGLAKYMARFPEANGWLDALGYDPR